jgi:hypothetical protein
MFKIMVTRSGIRELSFSKASSGVVAPGSEDEATSTTLFEGVCCGDFVADDLSGLGTQTRGIYGGLVKYGSLARTTYLKVHASPRK